MNNQNVTFGGGTFRFSLMAALSLICICSAWAADPVISANIGARGQMLPGQPARNDLPSPQVTDMAAALGQITAQRIQWATAGSQNALAREQAVQRLRQKAGPGLRVTFRPNHPTVMQIRGGVLEPMASGFSPAAAESREVRTAQNFLRLNRELLRLDEPENELKLERREIDALGQRHLRYSQNFLGLEVWPASASVHLDAAGNVTLFEGAYVPTPAGVSTQPLISVDEATQLAKGSLPGADQAEPKAATLFIYAPFQAAPRLAWRVELALNFMETWRFIVDARDGRVLSRASLSVDANATATGKDLNGKSQTFNVWSANGKYTMIDTTKQMFNPAFDPINDPHGVISIYDARNVNQNNLKTVYLVESTSLTDWIPDAVSALMNFDDTYDYFLKQHQRNSIDGSGGNVQAAVRIGEMDNAFWSGDSKMMFFGNARPYAEALDVVAHELTHGVTENSAGLIYELQPGAMNEAFSDIFGEMVEARTRGEVDWLLGQDLGDPFRDMKTPGNVKFGDKGLPSKMSEYFDLANDSNHDHGGVHINSSIINHAFYMLAEGLNGAIGLTDAEKIFYRCLTVHLQKQSQFIDARLGCVASAEELFGADSTQAKKVGEAFDAVEIFDKPATPAPTPIPSVDGPDCALFVSYDSFYDAMALGRYETAKGDPEGGIALVESVQTSRPAVSGDGSFALFIDGAWDLCGVNTEDSATLECIGFQGYVHSVAVSPDARYYAFVLRNPQTGDALNQINVYDIVTDKTATYNLVAPVIDSQPVGTVLYADSMVFTADSKQLIYDALTQLKFGTGSNVQRWSIFRLDLATETTTTLVTPQEGADFGNPTIGRAGNRYLAFDAKSTTSSADAVIVLDLFTGDAGVVAQLSEGLGYPSFTGDESAIVYAAPDKVQTWTGYSLYKQPLTANRLAPNGAASLWVKDALVGVAYRRGTFVSTNALPVVAVQSPANGTTFTPGAAIAIQATASDADGSVAKVEFYEGSDKIGESQAAPYKFNWTSAPSGSHRLFARAIDNLGGTADSTAVSITVGAAARVKLSATLNANRTLTITVAGPAGNYTLQQSTNLKDWADLQAIAIGAAGSTYFITTGTPNSQQGWYYRVRSN